MKVQKRAFVPQFNTAYKNPITHVQIMSRKSVKNSILYRSFRFANGRKRYGKHCSLYAKKNVWYVMLRLANWPIKKT